MVQPLIGARRLRRFAVQNLKDVSFAEGFSPDETA
jgi:hypothetical protein